MAGFKNAVANALGQLIITALSSPNYVPGVSGWIIKKDGSVEFNIGVFRGTIIISPTGSPAVLIYSGPPALGNLIIALSGFDGTDSFGNKFWTGLTFIHGASASGSLGRLNFGMNDATAADHGQLLSYVDLSSKSHVNLSGPGGIGSAVNLDLSSDLTTILGGPNQNQLVINDFGGGVSLQALQVLTLLGLNQGIQFGQVGSLISAIQGGSFTASFSAANSASGTLTFPNAFPSVPKANVSLTVGANNDILPNWQSKAAGSLNWRFFQKGGIAVTTTVTADWWAWV